MANGVQLVLALQRLLMVYGCIYIYIYIYTHTYTHIHIYIRFFALYMVLLFSRCFLRVGSRIW